MPFRNLNVLDAAEQAAKQVNALIDRSKRPPLLHVRQPRDSAQSVVANIAEGFGRGTGRDRNRPLQIARGESEETIRHLNANFQANRIGATDYRPLHNPLRGNREDAELTAQRLIAAFRSLAPAPLSWPFAPWSWSFAP